MWGNSLPLTGLGKYFLKRTLVAQALISKINKWGLMKLKSFYMEKDTAIMKKQETTE